MVPERRQLFGTMSVEENLLIGAYARSDRPSQKQLQGEMEHVFALFPRLRERRRQLAQSMSGGEQQMTAIARGLMAKPRLLLLDEPSLGLAPLIVDQIVEQIERLRDGGCTILLVEQNARLALSISDRGYIVETGASRCQEAPPNFLPMTAFRQLSRRPQIRPTQWKSVSRWRAGGGSDLSGTGGVSSSSKRPPASHGVAMVVGITSIRVGYLAAVRGDEMVRRRSAARPGGIW